MPTRRRFVSQGAAIGAALLNPFQVGRAVENVTDPRTRGGKVTPSPRARIKSLTRREDTIRRMDGSGDNWHMSWAHDDSQYVSLCDGAGFSDLPREFHNSRLLRISGGPLDARFLDVAAYPSLSRPKQKPSATRYYNFGTLAIGGHVYQFLSTFNRSLRVGEFDIPDANDPMRFIGCKLIYSPDNGRTWHNQDGSTPVVWEPWNARSRKTMAFYDEDQDAFSLISILQMGKNYELNRDGYIYAYAPNGSTDGTMNELVMFRVPRAKLLDRHSYEYYAGQSGPGEARWQRNIDDRRAVHTFPRGWVNRSYHPWSWMPSVTYNAPLDLYMMASWGTGSSPSGHWFAKPSYLGFWVAPEPWGPWTQIHEESAWLPNGDTAARAFAPQISPKWIAQDGRSFWLIWSDFQVNDQSAAQQALQQSKQNFTVDAYTEDEVVRDAAGMRRYMPHYTFNAQKVDLTLG